MFIILLKNSKILKFRNPSFRILPIKTLYYINKDVFPIVESFEYLPQITRQQKNIGLYKKYNILFEKPLFQKYLLLKIPFKDCKILKKSFNSCFVKYKYKRKFH